MDNPKFKIGDKVNVLPKPTAHGSYKFEGKQIVITKVIPHGNMGTGASGRNLGNAYYAAEGCDAVWEGDLELSDIDIYDKKIRPA